VGENKAQETSLPLQLICEKKSTKTSYLLARLFDIVFFENNCFEIRAKNRRWRRRRDEGIYSGRLTSEGRITSA
jgi:hypothetical protein